MVESKDDVPPRYRRTMKVIGEESHSAAAVQLEAKSDEGADVQEVINDALAKQKATGDRIITFEALAKKKGEKAPTIRGNKAREGKQLTTSSKGNSARTQKRKPSSDLDGLYLSSQALL